MEHYVNRNRYIKILQSLYILNMYITDNFFAVKGFFKSKFKILTEVHIKITLLNAKFTGLTTYFYLLNTELRTCNYIIIIIIILKLLP